MFGMFYLSEFLVFLGLIIPMWASNFVEEHEEVRWIEPCVRIWRGGWIGSVVMGRAKEEDSVEMESWVAW